MIIPEIAATVNSDPDTTLNDLLYIMDYKQFGESSGVFQNKDALSKALMTWYAVNDTTIRKDAVISANSDGRVGELLAKQYGVNLPQLKEYKTFDAIKNSNDLEIAQALYTEEGKLSWLFDEEVLDDTFYTSRTALLMFENPVEGTVASPLVDIFYTDKGNEYASTIDKSLLVYNKGPEYRTKFINDDWIQKVYNHSSDARKTATISKKFTESASMSRITSATAADTKVLLRLAASHNGSVSNGKNHIYNPTAYNSNGVQLARIGGFAAYYQNTDAIWCYVPTDDFYIFGDCSTEYGGITFTVTGEGA